MTAMGPFFERRWDSGGVAMDRFPVPNHLDAIPILQSAITGGFSDSLVSLEGDGYYWIVKPGLKAGELIELGTRE